MLSPEWTGDVAYDPDYAEEIPNVDYPPPMLDHECAGSVLELPHYTNVS
jgi:hypothetical protein